MSDQQLLSFLATRRIFPRFFNKVDFFGPLMPDMKTRCWQWRGSLSSTGYGQFRFEGTTCRAHRVAYEVLIGPIPERDPTCPRQPMSIDHLCSNKLCVNPHHMEIVTLAENTRRGPLGEVTRQRMLAKTHCPQGHPYSGDNLYVTPKGHRDCRTCRRDAGVRLRNRKAMNRV